MHSTDPAITNGKGAFGISSHRLERGIAFVLKGEVDLASASIVEDELTRAALSESLIVMDLEGVSFMDSTGLRMVIAADRRLRERGACLQLVHVPRQVQRLFELVGIAAHLDIADPAENATNGAVGL